MIGLDKGVTFGIWMIHWGVAGAAFAALACMLAARRAKAGWLRGLLGQALPMCLAVGAVFSWMSPSQPIAVHDFYHYRFESLYLQELGYDSLYECSIAALPPAQRPDRYRSQSTYELRAFEPASEQACQAKLGAKWPMFQGDARNVAGHLGVQGFAIFVGDRGYNGSPFWAAIHSMWMPSNFKASIIWSSVINLACLAGALIALGAGLGWGRAGLGALCAMAMPMVDSSWIAGGPGRFDWVLFSAISMACAAKGRWGVAGIFAGAAGALRLFPLAGFVLGMLALILASARRSKAAQTMAWKAIAASCVSFAAFMGLGAAKYGLDMDLLWFQKVMLHEGFLAWNTLGSKSVVVGMSLLGGAVPSAAALAHFWIIPFAMLALFTAMAVRAKGPSEPGFAIAAGYALVFWLGTGLSHYYWIGWIMAGALIAESLAGAALLLAGSLAMDLLFATFPQAFEMIPLAAGLSSLWVALWHLGTLACVCWAAERRAKRAASAPAPAALAGAAGEA